MTDLLFTTGLALFAGIFLLKGLLALGYWKRNRPAHQPSGRLEAGITLAQPILSGDPALEGNLTRNLEGTKDAELLWLIDRDDREALRIARGIIASHPDDRQRVRVLEVEAIPEDLNPKVYKLKLALPLSRRYFVVLDDDTVVDGQALASVCSYLEDGDALVTGVPVYRGGAGFFTKLVAGFVNANALFLYLPMASLEAPRTINGMFYAARAEGLRSRGVFEAVEDRLCDDFEVARQYRHQGLPIRQAAVPCRVTTTISGFRHYLGLMKRWMLFAHSYVRVNPTPGTLALAVLPSLLPLALLVAAGLLGTLPVFLAVHGMKALVARLIRRRLLGTREPLAAPLYEMFADYLLPLHYGHALLFPRSIQWRSRRVRLGRTGVRFEK